MKTLSHAILTPVFVSLLLIAGCAPSLSETEDMMDEDPMEDEVREEKEPSKVVEQAPDVDTSCAAQSCGEEGTEVTCLRANGCYCTDAGCSECRKKNETCEVSADCCGGQGLECQSVTLTSGSTEKRCLVLMENICNISCTPEGVWGSPTRCANDILYEDIEDCDTFEGACMPPIEGERPRRCMRS